MHTTVSRLSHAACCLLLAVLASAAVMCRPSARTDYQLRVWSNNTPTVQAGLPTILCMDITDTSGHSVLRPLRLRQLHSRLLHVVLIPATYSAVLHVHMEDYPALLHAYLTSDHCAAVNVTLPTAGRWVVGVNLWPTDTSSMTTTGAVMDVFGSPHIDDYPIDTRSLQTVRPLPLLADQTYTAAVQRNSPTPPDNSSVIIDVQLDRGRRPVRAGECCSLALSVSTAAGEPIVDLLPLLTLPAHLFLFYYNSSTDDYHFHHLHAHQPAHSLTAHCSADSMDSMAETAGMHQQYVAGMAGMAGMSGMRVDGGADERFGPMVQAAGVKFDCPGRWLVIGQLRRASENDNTRGGDLLTVMMDVRVE